MIEKVQITNSSVIESIRANMPVANVDDKGLMPNGANTMKSSQSSILLIKEKSANIMSSSSYLLSYSIATGQNSNLLFISASRTADSAVLKVQVKVLGGGYSLKVKYKSVNGIASVYLEIKEYTPIVSLTKLSSSSNWVVEMESTGQLALDDCTEADVIN